MNRSKLFELFPLIVLWGALEFAGGGCTAQSPEAGDNGEGTEVVAGVANLDSTTGSNYFGCPYGTGTPPAQLCDREFGECTLLANGIQGNVVNDLVVLPPEGDVAPPIGNLALLTPNALFFVNMTTRIATPSGVAVGANPSALVVSSNGRDLYVASSDAIRIVNIQSQRLVQTVTLPQGGGPSVNMCEVEAEDKLRVYYCGQSCGYFDNTGGANPPAAVPLADQGSGPPVCAAGRVYKPFRNSVQVLDAATASLVIEIPLPQANRCYVSEDGDCLYCTVPEGNNTTVVGFKTQDNTEFGRVRISGPNTFIRGSQTSRDIFIGTQNGITTCDRGLTDCKRQTANLTRGATFVQFNR